ncbi:Cacna1c, partial [Symbiodinium sp. CCMP2456]
VCAHLDARFEKLEAILLRPLMLDAGSFLTGNSNVDPELNTTGSFGRVLTAESIERESLGEADNSSPMAVRPRYSRE